MIYETLTAEEFFKAVNTEKKARAMIWKAKFGGQNFVCPHCQCNRYYSLKSRPEIRKCATCRRHIRLRAGTIFENSKTPLLIWVKAIYFVMQGKRGISVSEVMRHLHMKSYGTVWAMLHKIREALRQRDDRYKLKGIIELDGSAIGRSRSGNQSQILVAVEEKQWVDDKGRPKSRAGFAKMAVAPERKEAAQEFVDRFIEPGSLVNTDASYALRNLKNVDVDYQTTRFGKEVLDRWLPWVHRTVLNARAWINGTHHGIGAKYTNAYMAEYLYRFNRRHDPGSLFHRALVACAIAKPKTYGALFG